jgi:hypothetical protein
VNRELQQYNYRALREAGVSPDRAYQEADRWAIFEVQVLGHSIVDGRLFVHLCGTSPGAVGYEREM